MARSFVIAFTIALSLFTTPAEAICEADNRSLTELLASGKPGTIFTCRILSMSAPPVEPGYYASDGSISGTARAQVTRVFFGRVDSAVITLKTGWMLDEGASYIVYASGDGYMFGMGGDCDKRSHKLTGSAAEKAEIEILGSFSRIIKRKKSGKFDFKGADGITLATGAFKKGIPSGRWFHYFPGGTLKSERDLLNGDTREFSATGELLFEKKNLKDSTVIMGYAPDGKGEPEYRQVIINQPPGRVFRLYFFYPNGALKSLETSRDSATASWLSQSLGRDGPYREGYENGKPKMQGEYRRNRRVGLWIWYNEDGSEMTRFDYRNGEFGKEN